MHILCKAKQGRQPDENIRNSITLGPFDGPSIVIIEIRLDVHQKVTNCCISKIADEETKCREV